MHTLICSQINEETNLLSSELTFVQLNGFLLWHCIRIEHTTELNSKLFVRSARISPFSLNYASVCQECAEVKVIFIVQRSKSARYK